MQAGPASPARNKTPMEGGASFSAHRYYRAAFGIVWLLLARWTPPCCHGWRRWVLRLFGARLHSTSRIYSSARIWCPAHLLMDCHATIGPRVNCYNIAPLRIAAYAIVSQDAELVTGSHAPDNPAHPLVAAPITLGAHSWIAAGAFVGPGVTVGRGAVLGARCVCFKDCEEASIYIGNPARLLRRRNITF